MEGKPAVRIGIHVDGKLLAALQRCLDLDGSTALGFIPGESEGTLWLVIGAKDAAAVEQIDELTKRTNLPLKSAGEWDVNETDG